MSLPDLVVETLDKNERAQGVDYAQEARAVLQVRTMQEAAESAKRSAKLTAIATVLLVVTSALQVVVGLLAA